MIPSPRVELVSKCFQYRTSGPEAGMHSSAPASVERREGMCKGDHSKGQGCPPGTHPQEIKVRIQLSHTEPCANESAYVSMVCVCLCMT